VTATEQGVVVKKPKLAAARGVLVTTVVASLLALSSACGSPAPAQQDRSPFGGSVQKEGKGAPAADPQGTPPTPVPGDDLGTK
jgi:hypothetical protein